MSKRICISLMNDDRRAIDNFLYVTMNEEEYAALRQYAKSYSRYDVDDACQALRSALIRHYEEHRGEEGQPGPKARAILALQELKKANRLGNDLDAYLLEVAKWGLSERTRPDPAEFGLTSQPNEEQSGG